MQKVSLILFYFFICVQCSISKIGTIQNSESPKGILATQVLESTEKRNVSKFGFFIQKCEIEINSSGGKQKLLGSIKYEKPGKYLISLKSKAGIEAARIFISEDTILINDRLNRKIYYGSSDFLKQKYGISVYFLPVLLGDIVLKKDILLNSQECVNGELYYKDSSERQEIVYIVDCETYKIKIAYMENSLNEKDLEVKFSSFKNKSDVVYPGRIILKDNRSMSSITVKISRIESPWTGNLFFVPGNKYEVIKLL